MKYIILFFTSIILVSICSCKVIETLHPLSENADDFIFKKELLGKWGDPKEDSEYYLVDTITGTTGKLYKTRIVSSYKKNQEIRLDTIWIFSHLININKRYYLDCWFDLQSLSPKMEKDIGDFFISKHYFFRISFIGIEKIEVTAPDADEFIKLINSNKILLNYTALKEDEYLILNKPDELQRGLKEFEKYPLLFKEKDTLMRLR